MNSLTISPSSSFRSLERIFSEQDSAAAVTTSTKRSLPTWTRHYDNKHKGKTLPEILFIDPEHFFETFESGLYRYWSYPLRIQSEHLYARATTIFAPQWGISRPMVEYQFDVTGNFLGFEPVDRKSPLEERPTLALRRKFIDMRVPRMTLKNHPKNYDAFFNSFRKHLFKDPTIELTKERCEEFFSDSSAFDKNE